MQRKSDDDKRKTGTFRPGREQKTDSGGVLTDLPIPPWELTDGALRIYLEEGTALVKAGILRPTDVRLLAAFSSEMDVYISLMQTAQSDGIIITLANSIQTSSAARKAAESALKNASALASTLGINPIGRSRLGLKTDPTPPRKSDPLDFLNGGEDDPFSDFLRPMSN
jgi:P27 family predicted phage terminase small subunit